MVSKDEVVGLAIPGVNEHLILLALSLKGKGESLLLPDILDAGHCGTS